ncbi:hypothetical protein ACAG24_009870 [Mycobacterium sp. pW049]
MGATVVGMTASMRMHSVASAQADRPERGVVCSVASGIGGGARWT